MERIWVKCLLKLQCGNVKNDYTITGPYCGKCEGRSERPGNAYSGVRRLIVRRVEQKEKVTLQKSAGREIGRRIVAGASVVESCV